MDRMSVNTALPRLLKQVNKKAISPVLVALFALVGFAACDNAEDIPAILLGDTQGVSALLRPSIVSSNPAGNGGNYPGNLDIYADFNVAMDTEATRNAFSVTGAASPSGITQWDGDRRIKFTLDEDLVSGNSYLMKVGSNAKSKDGYLMNIDHLVYFTVGSTIEGPTVVSTTPADNDQAVDVGSSIRLVFSRAMDQSSTESAFSVSPSASGAFAWDADGLGFTYTPYTDLTFATTYSVTLGVSATDTEGIPLASSYNFSFQAGTDFTNPSITSLRESGGVTDITTGSTGVFKDAAFVVTFDEAMDYSNVESAFSLTRQADSSSVSGNFAWASSFTNVTFTPDSPLEPESWYLLEISTTATDVAGNSPDSAFQIYFYVDNSGTYSGTAATHSDYLTVNTVVYDPGGLNLTLAPIDSSTLHSVSLGGAAPVTITMRITFSNDIDAGTIAQNITISRLVPKAGASAATITSITLFTADTIDITLANFDYTDYLLTRIMHEKASPVVPVGNALSIV